MGQTDSLTASYTNHRRAGVSYDADGRLTQDDDLQYQYDAAGRKVEVSNYEGAITQSFDGDGQRIKQVQTVTNPASSEVTYYLRSSVLRGATVTELYATGNKKQTLVYAGSAVIARQQVALGPNIWGRISQSVAWQYSEPVTGSARGDDPTELDPMGVDAGLINPYLDPNYDSDWPLMRYGDAGNPGSGCMVDGLPINCNFVRERVRITGRVEAINSLGDFAGAPTLGGGGNWLWINQTTHVRSRVVGPGVEDSSWSPGETRMTGDWLFTGGLIAEGRQFAHAPQNPAPTGNCATFADMVEQIANETLGSRADTPGLDVRLFMNRLATTFTEFPAATLSAVTGLATLEGLPSGNGPRFLSSGFASSYFETGGNQVRHAVGGLIAGYVGIPLHDPIAGLGMNDREDPNDREHGVPDINLNNQTVPMGARIGTHNVGSMFRRNLPPRGAAAARGLANWIRRTLCAR